MTGEAPDHEMEASAKNWYNILATVTIKGGHVRPVEYVVIEDITDSPMFKKSLRILLEKGILVRGDIFVVDNYTVRIQWDNVGIQEALFELHEILTITPSHPQ